MASILTRVGSHEHRQDSRIILDVDSFEALQSAVPTVESFSPGDRGQIVLSGPGIGIAADLAGAEATWRSILGESGFSVQDVHGDGLSTGIIDWFVPADAPAGQGQANMGAAIPALVLVGAILAVLLFLGWLVLGRLQILLFGPDGTGGLAGAFPIGLLLLGAALVFLVVRSERKVGQT